GNLTQYPVKFDGTKILEIEIPGLAYSVLGTLVPVTGGRRFRLDFPTAAGINHRVQFRASISDQWSPVMFATTHNAPLNQTQLSGTGGNVSIFVDASIAKGFFAIVRES